MNAVEALDELIEQLDGSIPSEGKPEVSRGSGSGDAIDRVLASSPRTSAVRSLRDDPTIANFRRELVDGLIRADTAGQALRLLSQVVGAVLAGRV